MPINQAIQQHFHIDYVAMLETGHILTGVCQLNCHLQYSCNVVSINKSDMHFFVH